MRKVFIDVGGHEGQCVRVALDPKLAFDEIHTFEPHPDYAERLRQFTDPRVIVHQAALADREGWLNLFGDNRHGGATVATEVPGVAPIAVRSMDALAFIDGLGPDAQIFMKVNCEGGEVAIVRRLSQVPVRPNIISILVDYDVVKMRLGYWTKRRSITAARRARLPIVLFENALVEKSERGGLRNWLFAYPDHFLLEAGDKPQRQRLRRKIRYAFRDFRSAVGLHVSWRH